MKKILVILLLIPVFLFAKTNNLTKNKPAVEIQLLRNATMKITYNNKTILTDLDLCQYLGHNFFRFLRIFFLKFYRT